ncbi:hypothetical protein [uncultured Paraglaciecola sp.]|uniref:hypothetical protein n=1 Tax=uncultured Paraglaciecola sp. TaxID=1765024 RepID=UPI0026221329|nr:hypothetical protein [uncultured Paraglaciecola sp.]
MDGLTKDGRKVFCQEADIPESYLSSLISDTETARSAGAKTIAFLIVASGGILSFGSIRPELMRQAETHIKVVRRMRGKAA